MDPGEVASMLDELEIMEAKHLEESISNSSSKRLNIFEDLSVWNRTHVAENAANHGIAKELQEGSDQVALINFKAVMHTLQKTIAIEHAKKVREGKESVNMNEILRQKYSEDNYYFHDRILNSGLQKKDFTAPFLIDVKLINQDLGMTVAGKENEKKPKVNVITKIEPESEPVVTKEEPQKRKEVPTSDPTITSPTLYAMLEQPATKRLKVGESTTFVVPHTQPVTVQQQGSQTSQAARVTVAQSPTATATPTPTMAVSKQTRSAMPTLSPNLPTLNEINKEILRLPVQPPVRPPVAAKTPDTSHFVSIRPKLPISILTPEKVVTKSTSAVVNSGLFQNSEKDPDDDFSPRIINTQGSVVMVKGTPEKPVQVNGSAEIQTPKVVKVQQKNTTEIIPAKKSNSDTGFTIQGSGFLGCKQCGKTFPSNCDNLFRSHMIIKHNKEVTDSDILDAKIVVKSWFKCKKCKLMVLNNLTEHHKRCSPEIAYSNAFEAILVTTGDVPKLACGLCSESFESRVYLRAHLVEKHPDINNNVLLDPYFRCGICLLRFKDSTLKLIDHVSKCKAPTPTLETAQEIAQLNLDCEICSKKHSKIRETLFCYQVKTLLRCVLCLHVSISRANFFNHLKVHHNRRGVGICCPFCNDSVEKPTRQAFDHFIDQHYNVALKRAGEAALVRGRNQLKAQAAASKTPNNNNFNPEMARIARPIMQQRKAMPALRPKSFSPQQHQLQAVTGPRHVTTRFPAQQILQMNPGSGSVVGNHPFPPGTVLSLARIVSTPGGVPQPLPIGLTFVPTQNIQTLTQASAATLELMDTSAEDSILENRGRRNESSESLLQYM